MTSLNEDPRIPKLPHWSARRFDGQRVSLSGFLLAPTMERADRISGLVPGYLDLCRAAPGCLRAEIWRSRSDPLRFAVFLRFRSAEDYHTHARAMTGSDWWRATEALSAALKLHPE